MQLAKQNRSAERDATVERHREWLNNLERLTGKTLSAIALEIGIAKSTLTNKVDLKKEGRPVSPHHIDAIVARYGVMPPPSANGIVVPSAHRPTEDITPCHVAKTDPLYATIHTITAGRKNASPWLVHSNALQAIGFLRGDVVIIDADMVPMARDPVCAEVHDWRKGTAETVIRLYQPPYLIAASLDDVLRMPILMEAERVNIKGVILPNRLRAGDRR